MKNRSIVATALGLAVVTGCVLVPTSGWAEGVHPLDGGTPTTEPTPVPEDGIPDSLYAGLAKLDASSAGSTITDESWDSSTSVVQLHYVGSLPTNFSQTVAQYLPAGSFVLVQDAYAHDALVSQAEAIANDTSTNSDLISAGPQTDNSGVLVQRMHSNANTGIRKNIKPLTEAGETGAPVQTVYVDQTQHFEGSRNADTAPFYGGAAIFHKVSSTLANMCTLGFAVENSSGVTMGVTADHCGDVGQSWSAGLFGHTSRTIGTMGDGHSNGSDFKTISGFFDARDWLGSPYSTTSQAIKGAFTSRKGDKICVDGAWEGQHCGLTITNTGTVQCSHGSSLPIQCYNSEVTWTDKLHRGDLHGGDSGGPVLRGTSGGALVGGVVSMGSTTDTAPCIEDSSDHTCSWSGSYADIHAWLKGNTSWSLFHY